MNKGRMKAKRVKWKEVDNDSDTQRKGMKGTEYLHVCVCVCVYI